MFTELEIDSQLTFAVLQKVWCAINIQNIQEDKMQGELDS